MALVRAVNASRRVGRGDTVHRCLTDVSLQGGPPVQLPLLNHLLYLTLPTQLQPSFLSLLQIIP